VSLMDRRSDPAGATLIAGAELDVVAPVVTPYVRYGKPVIDRLLALVALVVFLPVLVVVAIAVRITMGRGVLYRQARIGLHGRTFTIVKFRTMQADRRNIAADRRRERREQRSSDRRLTHKHPKDPRHTSMGRFLRATSLDELPQLWNVLKGDMSLCGPRPELVAVVERYEPWQHRRHAVKPGLTGIWQLSGHRNEPMHTYVWMDLEYVDTVSFRTDVRLLWRTATSLLLHRGS
jgi:lipopolysaccharide/colanic/teichoic acid biosynthesis glycosyltransferase